MPSHPHRFTPQQRLHYSWEYRCFFKNSQVFRLSECTIYRIPNNLTHFRLGMTLKARGSSVERNRVKRQIREIFRTHGSRLGAFDYNVVIPVHKKMTYLYSQKLAECLRLRFINLAAEVSKAL